MSQKFLDLAGLKTYDKKIKDWIKSSIVDITEEAIKELFVTIAEGPADSEIWYTTSDNNKLTWWALDYVPAEQTATLAQDYTDGNVYYTPGEPGYERIYGYNVLYHDFDKDKNCFVLKFDKPLTEAFWKFGHPTGGDGGGASSGQNITSFILPNSVNYIMEYTFWMCSFLTSVTIPNSVKSIGNNAFAYCSYLTSIIFEGTMEEWNSITKGSYWNDNTPATYVQCSDGRVEL